MDEDEIRVRFLDTLHGSTRQYGPLAFIDAKRVGDHIGIGEADTQRVARFLENEGFLTISMGWQVSITHEGAKEAEARLRVAREIEAEAAVTGGTMTTVEEKKAQRRKFLHTLWDLRNEGRQFVREQELREWLGFENAVFTEVRNHLKDERLIRMVALPQPQQIGLTHEGVLWVEADLTAKANPPAPAAGPVIHIAGDVTNAQFMQNSPGGSQVQQISGADREALGALLAQVMKALKDLGLSEVDQNDVAAQATVIQAQLKSSKPKSLGWFRESFGTVRDALVKASADAAVMAASHQLLPPLLAEAHRLYAVLGG